MHRILVRRFWDQAKRPLQHDVTEVNLTPLCMAGEVLTQHLASNPQISPDVYSALLKEYKSHAHFGVLSEPSQYTLLYKSIEEGSVEKMQAIVKEYDINLSIRDKNTNKTPLSVAATCGNSNMKRVLEEIITAQEAALKPSSQPV